jgi:hypothetical protein
MSNDTMSRISFRGFHRYSSFFEDFINENIINISEQNSKVTLSAPPQLLAGMVLLCSKNACNDPEFEDSDLEDDHSDEEHVHLGSPDAPQNNLPENLPEGVKVKPVKVMQRSQ